MQAESLELPGLAETPFGTVRVPASLPYVLGLARTGLIFTGIQEGAQPGGLTQPGQTEQGIPYHVPSCWVPVGGSWAAGAHSRLGSAWRRSRRERLCSVGLFCVFPFSVSSLFLFPSVCCSVKLPLSQPTGFCLFCSHSPPHPGGGRGGRVALLLPAAAEP